MVKSVTQSFYGETKEMKRKGGMLYEGKAKAPETAVKTAEPQSYYPLQIQVEDTSGNIARERRMVEVINRPIFPLKLTVTNSEGEEQGYMVCETDIDIGDTNDFEIRLSLDSCEREMLDYGSQLYISGTEYGGILEDIRIVTGSNEFIGYGYTWRGLLMQKVVQPPHGAEHLILNGELNAVVRQLVGSRFGSFFVVDEVDTGVTVVNWKVDRYVTLHDALMKLLEAYQHRLQIEYIKPEGAALGAVHIKAVPISDYSDYIEYDQDCHVDFDIRDYRRGINHLICAGKGQNEERIILHLYIQEDGSIGKIPYYTGIQEREAVYDFSGADLKQLEADGIKRLRELRNYKSVNIRVNDVDLEIGDIIGGREQITGTEVKKPIVGKILRISGGRADIEYKVKGED